MREENYDKLRQALNELPSYNPAPANWDAIADKLGAAPEPTVVGKALPAYSPPSKVWNKLNGELDQQRVRRQKMKVVYRWVARAAAVLLIFGAGYAFASYDEGPTITYAVSQESRSNASLVSKDWSDEEASFDLLMERLAEIDEPELNALRLELEELTAAKKEVEDMLEAYGNDADVIKQLVEIETERSRVYRRAYAEL